MINTRTCINQESEKGRKEDDEVERDLFLSKKVSLKRHHAGRDVRGCEGCVKAPERSLFQMEGAAMHKGCRQISGTPEVCDSM